MRTIDHIYERVQCVYAYIFARESLMWWNDMLITFGLRGIGINNSENRLISGEKYIIEKYIKNANPCIVDIGAHHGQTSEILLNTLKLLPKENLKLSFKEIASELLVDFMHYPSKSLSQIYSHVIMYEDQEERVQFRMCEHITTLELLRRIVCGKEIKNHNLWVEGSISISYAHCAHLWQHLINFRRTIGVILRK